jgi:4-amino-4-deoxy-L-arabinose transferase-like glycosyltransferase
VIDYSLKKIIKIALLSKLCILIVIIIGFNLFPFNEANRKGSFLCDENAPLNLSEAIKGWDAQHYVFLAKNGYRDIYEVDNVRPRMTLNKYPLYPILIANFKWIFLNNYWLCAIALSNIFSMAAIILFFLLVEKLYDSKTATIASILLLSFPTSFYLSLMYAESLFLLLSVALFYSLYTRKLMFALVAAFFLPLSRPQGVLFIAPLAVFLLPTFFRKEVVRGERARFISVAISLAAGFICYLLFMKIYTGSFFTGIEANKFYIAQQSISNMIDIRGWFTRNFFDQRFVFHSHASSFIDKVFFVSYLALLIPIYKFTDKALFSYALIMGAIPALTTTYLAGFPRYLLLVFPIFIALARITKERYYYAAIFMVIIQTIFLLAHSLYYCIF